MRRSPWKRWSHCLGLSLALLCTTCGGKSGGATAALIACSLLTAGLQSSSLTVGLSQALLDSLQAARGFSADPTVLNDDIKASVNSALKTVGLLNQLEVKAVKSVPNGVSSDDGVRFFEIGGTLAPGVSFASSLLKNLAVQQALTERYGLRGSEAFRFVEDSFRVYSTGRVRADSRLADPSGKQWAYSQTNLTAAQSAAAALPDVKGQVVVAVIDTGVDLDHAALADNIYKVDGQIKGYDFANDDADPDDDQGHGTHCAGIIAAKSVAAEGMVGVGELLAPDKIKIMPVKVLDKKGAGSTDAINKGIRFAMAQGADVISMSLGGGVEFSDLLKSNGTESQILRDAVNAGIIVIVAAGNESCPLGGACNQQTLFVLNQTIKQYTVLPCSYNGTICVGASDPDAKLASYSNYASSFEGIQGVDPALTAPDIQRTSPDIIAPGSAIYSTYTGNTYKSLDGTSMATPYVAGLAALFKLKTQASAYASDGSAQKAFRRILQASALNLVAETDSKKQFVGQVDLAYYMAKLRELNQGIAAGDKPVLSAAPGEEPAASNPAPSVLAALCGGG